MNRLGNIILKKHQKQFMKNKDIFNIIVNMSWDIISEGYLDIEFAKKHKNKLYWKIISEKGVLYDEFIKVFGNDYIDWDIVSRDRIVDLLFLQKNKEKINFKLFFRYNKSINNDIITALKDEIDWKDLKIYHMNLKFKIKMEHDDIDYKTFIEIYKKSINWCWKEFLY